MDKFEDFYKEHCLDHFGYDPDLNWVFEKHEDGSYIQIEVENTKKVFQHQQAKVEELKNQFDQHDKLLLQRNKDVEELYDINEKHAAEKAELQKRVDAALKKLDKRRDELWSKWKWQADMQDQGAANAFEEAYWILEQAIKGEGQ